MGLTRAHRTVALTLALTLVAVGGAVAARQLLDRSPRFTDPTLTETQASQVAASLATALDDLAARFLVGDPATEHLQVLRWDDDVATAPERFAEHLGMIGDASAFVHANAVELERRRDLGAVTAIETRVWDHRSGRRPRTGCRLTSTRTSARCGAKLDRGGTASRCVRGRSSTCATSRAAHGASSSAGPVAGGRRGGAAGDERGRAARTDGVTGP